MNVNAVRLIVAAFNVALVGGVVKSNLQVFFEDPKERADALEPPAIDPWTYIIQGETQRARRDYGTIPQVLDRRLPPPPPPPPTPPPTAPNAPPAPPPDPTPQVASYFQIVAISDDEHEDGRDSCIVKLLQRQQRQVPIFVGDVVDNFELVRIVRSPQATEQRDAYDVYFRPVSSTLIRGTEQKITWQEAPVPAGRQG